MSQEIAQQNKANYEIMEKVIAEGDLSKLSAQERVMYYNKTCESLGLNPLTQPFQYIKLNGKLTLYTRKDATEQLRKINKVSIIKLEGMVREGVYIVTAHAKTHDGQEDIATGAVAIKGLMGDALANAFLKAETKAKRRVTLSICGLGLTDESEISSLPTAQAVQVNVETGELLEAPKPDPKPAQQVITKEEATLIEATYHQFMQDLDACGDLDQLKSVFDQIKAYDWKGAKHYLTQLLDKKDEIKGNILSVAKETNPE